VAEMHARLSDDTVWNRFFRYVRLERRASHENLSRTCFSDYGRNLIFVAEQTEPEHVVIGLGQLSRIKNENAAEFAVMVQDSRHGQGLGKQILQHLIEVGRKEGLARIVGYLLVGNDPIRVLCEKMGFTVRKKFGEDILIATLTLED